MHSRGFTLVETAIVATIAVILVSAAWPSWQSRLAKARRADAIAALTKVQLAQEQHRAHHGVYAGQLGALVGAASPFSPEGLYEIRLEEGGGDRFAVVASVRPGSAQRRDVDCPWLALRVDRGMAEQQPGAACWNR